MDKEFAKTLLKQLQYLLEYQHTERVREQTAGNKSLAQEMLSRVHETEASIETLKKHS